MFKIFPSTIKGIKKLNKIEMPNVMITVSNAPNSLKNLASYPPFKN